MTALDDCVPPGELGEAVAVIPHDRPVTEAVDLFLVGHEKVFVTRQTTAIGVIRVKDLLAAVRDGIN